MRQYKVGDTVTIRSWVSMEREFGDCRDVPGMFTDRMRRTCGTVVKITDVIDDDGYRIEDGRNYIYTPQMFTDWETDKQGVDKMKLITRETLKKWNACESGYKTFCRLLPDGAALQDASNVLIADGHADYATWLWCNAKSDDAYASQTSISAGDGGTATAGNGGTATAGDYGTATAGNSGCIVIRNHKLPFLMVCASVDGSKIKPNTPYQLDDYGHFVELTK